MSAPKQAIPTEYQGVKMRSRFEANAACMLDTFGIAWDYEPQSFHMGNAGHYWPDFKLPGLHSWLECRGYHGRDEQLDAWSARCAAKGDRFVVIRGDGPAWIAGPGFDVDDAGLRFCHDCRAWSLDTFDETHECSACGHMATAAEPAVAFTLGAKAGAMSIGDGQPIDAILSAIRDANDERLIALMRPTIMDAVRIAMRAHVRGMQRGEVFDLNANWEYLDACKAARENDAPDEPVRRSAPRQAMSARPASEPPVPPKSSPRAIVEGAAAVLRAIESAGPTFVPRRRVR